MKTVYIKIFIDNIGSGYRCRYELIYGSYIKKYSYESKDSLITSELKLILKAFSKLRCSCNVKLYGCSYMIQNSITLEKWRGYENNILWSLVDSLFDNHNIAWDIGSCSRTRI